MDKQTKKILFIIVGIILIIGLFLYLYFRSMFGWNETFHYDDKDPYGTSVISEVIKKSVGENAFHVVKEEPLDTLTKIDLDTIAAHSNYIYIGDAMFLNDEETNFILNFTRQGNNTYLISKTFDQNLLDSLFLHPKILLADLLAHSYTSLDDKNEERIPCGFYDKNNIWHATNFKNPNGYLDEHGDWQPLKPKNYDEQKDVNQKDEDSEDNVNDNEEIITEENDESTNYWPEIKEEEPYDAEADTIGYYGQDGKWITAKDSANLAYTEYLNKLYRSPASNGIYIDTYSDSVVWMDFYNEEVLDKSLESSKIFNKIPINYHWQYFQDQVLDDIYEKPSLLGNFKGMENNETYTNFIALDYGEGKIFLHTTPLLFTNYFQIKRPYFDYAQEVFSDLGKGNVIWDESIRNIDEFEYENELDNPKYHPDQGPLTFILSEPSLKWAWYTLLIALILYMMFGLRRNQRIIPVTIPNRNTSKEYAQTIGQLYMSKGNHRDIYRLKMDLFKAFLLDRYGIRVNDDPKKRQEIQEAIAAKSEISKEHISDIFKTFNINHDRDKIMTSDLVFFHDLLEEFYKKCK